MSDGPIFTSDLDYQLHHAVQLAKEQDTPVEDRMRELGRKHAMIRETVVMETLTGSTGVEKQTGNNKQLFTPTPQTFEGKNRKQRRKQQAIQRKQMKLLKSLAKDVKLLTPNV